MRVWCGSSSLPSMALVALTFFWAGCGERSASNQGTDAGVADGAGPTPDAEAAEAGADAGAVDSAGPTPDAEAVEAGADAWANADAAGPAGFFMTGELAGQTWLAEYNLQPIAPGWALVEANVAAGSNDLDPTISFWSVNAVFPAGPFPVTLPCASADGNGIQYLTFHDYTVTPRRWFSSRAPTASCSFTFVEPSVPDSYEGTFTANLREAGTETDYPVTGGRFRFPRAR